MNIGKPFRNAREKCGLSQRQFADVLGITSSALSKIESGKNFPKQKTIDALCRHMEIPVAYFYHEAFDEGDFGIPVQAKIF